MEAWRDGWRPGPVGDEASTWSETNMGDGMTDAYHNFLQRKMHSGQTVGLEPRQFPSAMFPFQQYLTTFALQRGRSALFEACGLGKTIQQLAWADNVVRATGKRVLILTPLAVSRQTIREGEKFGIACELSRTGDLPHKSAIVVTNYEQLHHFSPHDFIGVVADESSCLKDFQGVRRRAITTFLRTIPYRLLCSATPSPNDYIELGTSSEALGELGYIDMLNRFFRNQSQNTALGRMRFQEKQWRFKGHAEQPFWRWVCSWARAIQLPSDLGFDDTGYRLPPLTIRTHLVKAASPADGMLFELPAWGLREQRDERRRTIHERCAMAAALVNQTTQPAIIWCQLNPEGDLLERMIPDAEQISGKDTDTRKEDIAEAFCTGRVRVLVSKTKIFGYGLNFQHCAHVVYFPSHSYEARHQAIRRSWRFGQTHPVVIDDVLTEGDRLVVDNMQRKAEAAERMFAALVATMHDHLSITQMNDHLRETEVPPWLS